MAALSMRLACFLLLLWLGPCRCGFFTRTKRPAEPPPSPSGFPSNNSLARVTGKELQEILSGSNNAGGKAAANEKSSQPTVVIFFYLDGCPNSMAMKPVVECLPAFFPPEVLFVAVEYRDMSLLGLMAQGLHALPVLQVTTRGKKYRYSGKHHLVPLLKFVAKALGQDPLTRWEAAQLCSADGADCGGWVCRRWDGEVTVEELVGQQHAAMFYVSVAFLAARILWCLWSRARQRTQARPDQQQQEEGDLAAAAAAAGGAAAMGPGAAHLHAD